MNGLRSIQLSLAHILRVQVIIEPVHRALAAIARVLDAAKRRGLGGQRAFVA